MSANQPDDNPRILVVDVETTSVDPRTGGLVEIGAEWLHSGERWQMKCRPRHGALIDERAIEINGCDWLNDPTVACEGEALEGLLEWVGKGPVILAGNNPRFDFEFLREGVHLLGPEAAAAFPFVFRTVDMHSLAVAYQMRRGKVVPDRGLYTDEIFAALGMPPEPKPHRAQVGASMEAQALRMLLGVTDAA